MYVNGVIMYQEELDRIVCSRHPSESEATRGKNLPHFPLSIERARRSERDLLLLFRGTLDEAREEKDEIGRSCDWPGVLRATEAAEARWTHRAHREHAQRVFYSADKFAFPLHQTRSLSLFLSLRHPGTRIFIYLRAGCTKTSSSSRFRFEFGHARIWYEFFNSRMTRES